MRHFQKHGGSYKSGFEKTISDKLGWFKLKNANLYAAFGVVNVLGFGLSKFMNKDTFEYYCHYKGDGKVLRPLTSMLVSDKIENVIWTAPSLILGGMYL